MKRKEKTEEIYMKKKENDLLILTLITAFVVLAANYNGSL